MAANQCFSSAQHGNWTGGHGKDKNLEQGGKIPRPGSKSTPSHPSQNPPGIGHPLELRLNFGVIALIGSNAKSRAAILEACANEGGKKRMRGKRLRFEFRMKLAANEPRMIGHFDNFDIHAIGCPAGNAESGARERLLVLAIKFVAMAVALGDFERAVSLMRKRPG